MIAASGFGRRGCDVSHLIGTADAYNHDIPTEAMIERSIGLMTTTDDLVALTTEGRRLAKQAEGGMFERSPNMLRLLRTRPVVEGRWSLPPGAWQGAYDR